MRLLRAVACRVDDGSRQVTAASGTYDQVGTFPTPTPGIADTAQPRQPSPCCFYPRQEAETMTRKDAGFTLIEAMTVIAIVAVTLAVGIPAFGGTLQRHRVRTAMHLLSADMAMARSTAIMRRGQIVVCPRTADNRCRDDRDWRHGWLVFTDEDRNRQPDGTGDILRVRDAPSGTDSGLTLTSSRRFLRYQRDGRSANANLTVRVCAGERLAGKVIVNNLGRVRSARPVKPTPCPRG
ncbi:GspH/FimT family pseudopilin [Luteimonas salinilitoris]|uniref:GspH/FimT family pseudopilin n=1 Tax=Luteimonas salinilitoris TaxID=3237697 RepID=UPI00351C77F9